LGEDLHAKGPDTLRTVSRLFRLMEVLVEQDNASLAELALLSGLHKTTTYRFLTTLSHHGWVTPDAAGYALGPQFLALCSRALSRYDLRSVAQPFLERLRDETEESANLGVLQDGRVTSLSSADSKHPLRMSFEPGRQSPFHATGLGKAMAAFLPDRDLDELIAREPLQRHTPTTITDPQKLREHLRRVRQHGYAMDDMELTDQVRCVAAPIFDARGALAGAISVSGPAFRMTLDRLAELSGQVCRAARAVSARLGYQANGQEAGGAV
jgi:DNA-binding IclR family transcriptional regulator